MRISVEVSEDILKEVMAMTGEKSKGASLARAVMEFVKRRKAYDVDSSNNEKYQDSPVPPLGHY
ncbi:MAG: hypothetical protein EBS96_14995 [Spartobacteria bacterium]|nr:hypothetical protein [Spartobacteria bacterium]